MIYVMIHLIVCLSVVYKMNWSLRDARVELKDQGFEDLRRKDQKYSCRGVQGPKVKKRSRGLPLKR